MRTFVIHYRLRGLAVAYDDVVDVNLQVWGSEWDESLGRLIATESGPGRVVRAWGHPVYVRGDVQLAGKRVILRAVDIPAGQFVELRTVFPRSAFASTTGMRVAKGIGLPGIIAAETADAAAFEADSDRIENAKQHPWRYVAIVLLFGTIPALLVVGAVFWFYGRERRSGYDREYEQEPPTDTEPALVPILVRQGGEAGSFEFTATLFDLIRRGVFTATPVVTERSTWAGLRKESISDLEIGPGTAGGVVLRPWENAVSRVVDGVIEDGPERLSLFRKAIEKDRVTMSGHFTTFKSNVATAVGTRGWFISRGAALLALALVLFLAIGALLVYLAADGWRTVYPRWSDVVLVGFAVAALLNAALVVGAAHPAEALAAALPRRRGRGGALGGFSPLSHRLPAPRRGTARDARPLGTSPRLRDRLRDCRESFASCASCYA